MRSQNPKQRAKALILGAAMLAGTGCTRSPETASAQTASQPEGVQLVAEGADQAKTAQPFVYKSKRKLKAVALVGSFNGWDKTRSPMTADADGLTWRLSLPLAPGRYVYKFAPFGPEEETWVVDPNAPRDETDKTNQNSLRIVAAPGAQMEAKGAPTEAKADAKTEAAQPDTADQPFVFKANRPLKAVSVVGSFNGWNKAKNPMIADADGVTWRANFPLAYGKYVYKFAQVNPDGSEDWVVDPGAPLDETDKVNDNSVLLVTPADYKTPASPNDGKTARSALRLLSGAREVGYDGGRVTLSLRARPGDLRAVTLQAAGKRYPMKAVRRDDLYVDYKASLPWNRGADLLYNFEIADGKSVREYGASGLGVKSRPFVLAAKGFKPYLLTDAPAPLKMNGPLTTQTVLGPSWAKNQPIYEVNLDTYKFPKGTAIREFEKHLPTLKEMGVGIVWFMPLHPRGYKKGYGSPYAVRDYADINPDLGTRAEFKSLVARAHALGLKVLMDWVPNHTSWDNAWIEAHPEWYVKDDKGEITQAQTWGDVAQLDYGLNGGWNLPLWNQMRDDMTLWVRDYDVDGFRCDVAGTNGRVPIEFWRWLRPQLDAIKPVFMLAEADNVELFPAFDMAYSWTLQPVMWDVCAGRKPATAIDDALRAEAVKFPSGAVQMRFLDNHDWHAHADWDWGKRPAIDTSQGLPQVAPLMLLCATLPGKPLVYNGQEMSLLKVDPPARAGARAESPVWPFYTRLLALHRTQAAVFEGDFTKIVTDNDDKIYAFTRQKGVERVLVVVNLSDKAQSATLKSAAVAGNYRDWFGQTSARLAASPSLKLAPWAYRVYVSRDGAPGGAKTTSRAAR